MTEERNEPSDAAVRDACDKMLELVKSMPRETDYDRVVMATGSLIGCAHNPGLSCAAFARAASWLLASAGQQVDVHVRGKGETIVYEGNTGIIRRFEVDDGEPVEVGGDTPTAMH